MEKWNFKNYSVQLENFDHDLKCFAFYHENNIFGHVYPPTIDVMNDLINELNNGSDPIEEGWEDGNGNTIQLPEKIYVLFNNSTQPPGTKITENDEESFAIECIYESEINAFANELQATRAHIYEKNTDSYDFVTYNYLTTQATSYDPGN